MLSVTQHKISIIIASVDRDEYLQRCLACIEKAYDYAKGINLEVLVIFQDKKEKSSIRTVNSELFSFYYLEKRGLSSARNFGIKKSAGEYLVFLDDDTVIREDFLSVLLKNILNNEGSAYCCRDTDPEKRKLYSGRFSGEKSKFLNYCEYIYFLGYAHIIKRSSIKNLGLYDERFGLGAKYPAAEESDIFFRLKQRGEKVIYLPKLVVYHPVGNETSELKCFNYAYAISAMLVKQMCLDYRYAVLYLFIITKIILKSFFRTLQILFFPKNIEGKNKIYQYKSVLIGSLKGARDYICV
jgi:glycosyltransferase involved in cell wall biosynthesis